MQCVLPCRRCESCCEQNEGTEHPQKTQAARVGATAGRAVRRTEAGEEVAEAAAEEEELLLGCI